MGTHVTLVALATLTLVGFPRAHDPPSSFWCSEVDTGNPDTWAHDDRGEEVEVFGSPEPDHGGLADDACLVNHSWVGQNEEEEEETIALLRGAYQAEIEFPVDLARVIARRSEGAFYNAERRAVQLVVDGEVIGHLPVRPGSHLSMFQTVE